MSLMDLLHVETVDAVLIIDARDAIRQGYHPRQEILSLVKEAPTGKLCEVHVPHKTGPLIGALEALGLNVIVSEVGPGHWRIRALKL